MPPILDGRMLQIFFGNGYRILSGMTLKEAAPVKKRLTFEPSDF